MKRALRFIRQDALAVYAHPTLVVKFEDPTTRLYTTLLLIGQSLSKANMAAILDGALDDRSDDEKFYDYCVLMTGNRGNKPCVAVVEEAFRQYGLAGLDALWTEGYCSPDDFVARDDVNLNQIAEKHHLALIDH